MMVRYKFDQQLSLLNEELILMGALCESAIAMSAQALTSGDFKLANKAMTTSGQIDQKERDIEGLCLRLLLQQQPVAGDLRAISAALKMITDMERIGHQSADISEIILTAKLCIPDTTFNIEDMADAAMKMVTESIDAFVHKDVEIAKGVVEYDDVVDEYFDRIKCMLTRQLSNPGTDGEFALDLLMIAKYFERIADHAVNIAQWVLFSITGSREGADENDFLR